MLAVDFWRNSKLLRCGVGRCMFKRQYHLGNGMTHTPEKIQWDNLTGYTLNLHEGVFCRYTFVNMFIITHPLNFCTINKVNIPGLYSLGYETPYQIYARNWTLWISFFNLTETSAAVLPRHLPRHLLSGDDTCITPYLVSPKFRAILRHTTEWSEAHRQ